MTDDEDAPPSSPTARPLEPTVKQLLDDPSAHGDALDPATMAELQRWFGLPSAMDLPPPEPAPEELSRREAAMAAVEPAFLEYLHRHDARVPFMLEPVHLELRTNEGHTTIAERFEAMGKLGEPREIEVPYLLIDDLRECVPQALLRDLHRVEEYFAPYYELTKVSDGIPDVRLHIAAAIAKGEQERELFIARKEIELAIRDRDEVRAMAWAESAVAKEPAASVEPEGESP